MTQWSTATVGRLPVLQFGYPLPNCFDFECHHEGIVKVDLSLGASNVG